MGSLDLGSAGSQVDQACAVARRLAAAGKPVSRRARRSGGGHGLQLGPRRPGAHAQPRAGGVCRRRRVNHPGVRRVACQPGQHLAHPRSCAGDRGDAGAPRSAADTARQRSGRYRSCPAAGPAAAAPRSRAGGRAPADAELGGEAVVGAPVRREGPRGRISRRRSSSSSSRSRASWGRSPSASATPASDPRPSWRMRSQLRATSGGIQPLGAGQSLSG